MYRCLQLAKRGRGAVAPNPLVGCVIVANNSIIGEGWHQQYGMAHAEVNAIQSISIKNLPLLPSATLYVNLEPCSHYGNTPPCVDLIIQKQIPNVVICNVDSNPLVGGEGVKRLKKHGVNVKTGLLKQEGRDVNRRFFTLMEKNRPYIILKWAQSKDGYFAKTMGRQTWITNEISRRLVHKWRSEEVSILVGNRTLKIDNPKLNNRFFEPQKQPIRILISKHIKNEKQYNFFDETQSTVIVNSEKESEKKQLKYWQFKFDNKLIFKLIKRLNKHKVSSVIIEGGAYTINQFIAQNLWDEARVLTGNLLLKEGINAPTIDGELQKEFRLNKDTITYYKNQ